MAPPESQIPVRNWHRSFSLTRRSGVTKNLSVKQDKPMYIHMFAFRLKPGVTDEQQARMLREIRALEGQIPGILETAVGKNDSPRGQGYTIGGVMKFRDKAALEAYNVHRVHQELLHWLVPLIEAIEVDFPA
jgi:hypothetical protein